MPSPCPGGRDGKTTALSEGLVVDEVLPQCGEAGGRYGGLLAGPFGPPWRLAARPMHASTACMVGSAAAQSDGGRQPGWRCTLTASSTDGTGLREGTRHWGGIGPTGEEGLSALSPPHLVQRSLVLEAVLPVQSLSRSPQLLSSTPHDSKATKERRETRVSRPRRRQETQT